jgi:hypothetical protein
MTEAKGYVDALRARVAELERKQETADAIARDHGLLAEENEVLKDRLTILRAVAEAAEEYIEHFDGFGRCPKCGFTCSTRMRYENTITTAKGAGAL